MSFIKQIRPGVKSREVRFLIQEFHLGLGPCALAQEQHFDDGGIDRPRGKTLARPGTGYAQR